MDLNPKARRGFRIMAIWFPLVALSLVLYPLTSGWIHDVSHWFLIVSGTLFLIIFVLQVSAWLWEQSNKY